MSTVNRGKQFEKLFQEQWKDCFPQSFCYRLPDQQTGYFGTSKNICDFICYNEGKLFLIECKAHNGNTLPISNITQYDKLISYKDKPGIVVGILVWFVDHDKVYYVPIVTLEQMIHDEKKSINVKDIEQYNIVEIPSVKKRVLLKSDYSILCNQ